MNQLVEHPESAFQVKSSEKYQLFLHPASGQENGTKLCAPRPHIPDNCSYKDTRQLSPQCAKILCAMCLGLLSPEVIMEIVQLEAE